MNPSVTIKISNNLLLKHSKAEVDADPPQAKLHVTAAAPAAAETSSHV